MSRQDVWKASVREAIEVPPHIAACASACAYDLLHGPSWSRIPAGDISKFTVDDYATFYDDVADDAESGDLIQETYVGLVGDTLRSFIDDLPSEAWVDDCSFSTSEPEGEEIDGEWVEPYLDDIYHVKHRDIVEALFGRTIAREFR